jgi:drug/metabolite transporter (DMT)-like permease
MPDDVPMGILFMILSGVCYSVSSIIAVYLYDAYPDMNPLILVFAQTCFTQLIYTFELGERHRELLWDNVPSSYFGAIWYKSFSGTIASTTEIFCLDYFQISIVETIYNLSPVMVTIMSMTCIEEDVTSIDKANAFISFFGLFLVTAGEVS